ncbi:dbfb6803-5303-422c-918c-910c15fc0db7 [Thermothielavioides terrestris]|uniref:Dbfb6803-5303-422c-918c-910c15fc0db7 n=1 Tax=Thermothielavioides terrestris TaxID=2587410 RepID=A0A446BDU7_9PEZI|nr:dbfb6803-5303-422c-918c-910c15fc0db7 [Thermothielavioides terrestris]
MILQTSHLFRAVVATLAATAATCLAAPATCCSGAELPLPVRTVYQFTTETWIENLAVRPNGNLLLIVDENVTSPVHPVALYQLANPASPHPELSLVYSFPLGTVLGITEVQHEVYAVLAENFTGNFESVPGTTKMYTFDFNGGGAQPTVREVATMPNTTIGPDGIAALPGQPDIVLVADMYAASVWAVNITTGTTRLFAQAPEMAQVHNYTRMGINGLRVAYDYLYFTNSDLKCVFRIPMDVTGAQASPNVELVANLTSVSPVFIDDFTIGRDGTLWVTSNGPQNVVVAVRPDGLGGFQEPVVAAGGVDSTAVQGDVGAAFGRGPSDYDILYVVTNGGLWGAGLGLNHTATEPGKVAAVDTTCF